MERDRNDSGRYNDRIEPDSVLEIFEQRADRAEPLTANDVVDEMGIARRTAHNKLNALTERGVLETKKVGARGRVWWVPMKDGHSKPTESFEPLDDQSRAPIEESSENDSRGLESITEQQAKDVLEGIDITGRGAETKEVRRKAILHAWCELREKGEATTQELANSAFDEYKDTRKFGYGESSSHYRGYTFWDSCAREVFKQLPGVESPPERGNTWYFTGERAQ